MSSIYQKHRPVIGKKLYRLAVEWAREQVPGSSWARKSIPGITEATRQIEGIKGRKAVINGSRSKRAAAEATIAAAEEIREVLYKRDKYRRHTKPDLNTRLNQFRIKGVERLFRDFYRSPTSDHGNIHISTTDRPEEVGVKIEVSEDWNLYKGSFKGWAAKITDIHLTIPERWRSRVLHKRLASVDGLMTLDAQALEGAPQGVDLFAATWLVQKRGYEVEAVKGFIARAGDTAYHGDSLKKALQGLRRKLKAVEWQAKIRCAKLDQVIARLGDHASDLIVRVEDARRMGACEYGIQSWCHATGLPYEAGEAPLDKVYQAYQARPQSEARAAMLAAIRRQRPQAI